MFQNKCLIKIKIYQDLNNSLKIKIKMNNNLRIYFPIKIYIQINKINKVIIINLKSNKIKYLILDIINRLRMKEFKM